MRGQRQAGPRWQAGSSSGAREAPDRAALRAAALRLLARREYARAELAIRLERRGGAHDDVEATLDDLAAAGYLSDARYADMIVQGRAGRYGSRAIAHALKERGVEPAAAQEALVQLEGRDELEEARVLWARRFGTPPVDERDKARQVRFLLARGYGMSVALRVLRVVAAAARDGETPDAD